MHFDKNFGTTFALESKKSTGQLSVEQELSCTDKGLLLDHLASGTARCEKTSNPHA